MNGGPARRWRPRTWRLTAALAIGGAVAAMAGAVPSPTATPTATANTYAAAESAAANSWAPRIPRAKRVPGCAVRPRASCAGADLRGRQLFEALLRGADLRRARLGAANLSGGDLRGADLRGAKLSPARIPGRLDSPLPTFLGRADLRGADLRRARLDRVVAPGASLLRARLGGARLRGAQLANADLRGADLRRANLRGAELRRAMLGKADLRRARLTGADLKGADLRGARLRGANLVRATLAGALVTQRQLRAAAALCLTVQASGRPLRRDCARLRIRAPRPAAPHLHERLPQERGGSYRRLWIPLGPRLAQPRRGQAPKGAARASRACTPGPGPDCEAVYMAGLQFPDVVAPQGNFYRADFDWANLSGADLSGGFMALAQFDGADLSGANLTRINPGLQPLTDTATNFNYANLAGANLEGANLRGAQFLEANLAGANLAGAELSEANLNGANLVGANLQGAVMEGTQLSSADLREANLLGSFIYDASFSYTNLEGALLGIYMRGAPAGGFSGQEGSLNLDQAGWTCATTLPNGAIDNNDCRFTFQLLGELLAGIAESLSGFEFGVASNSVISAAARAALEDTTESVGGTAVRLVNWALFSGTPEELTEIVADSPTIGTALTEVLPVVKTLTVKAGGVGWEIAAPAVRLELERVREFLTRVTPKGASGSTETHVYSPIAEWSEDWEANLFHWWGSKPEGDAYAGAVDCPWVDVEPLSPDGEHPICEATGMPVMPPEAPSVARLPG